MGGQTGWMPSKRSIRRGVSKTYRKAKQIAKSRYFNKGGTVRLAKDVAFLKSIVNAEKKRKQVYNTQQALGQVSGNSSGHYLLDLTPVLTQGTGTSNRTGASVKWHSSHLDFLFQPQANCVKRLEIIIDVVKVNGQPFSTLTDVLGKYVNSNDFITDQAIYDTYCHRDPDYFKNFTVITSKKVIFDPSFSGELTIQQVKMGFKLQNHHIKWDGDAATVSGGQIFLMIRMNNGNSSGATSNTSASGGVYTTGISTGINFSYNHTHYFYDN